jgi:hypothetical protein
MSDNGLDRNITVRISEKTGRCNFYVANPCWWDAEVTLRFGENAEIRDLVDDTISSGNSVKFKLAAYGIKVFNTSKAPTAARLRFLKKAWST